MRTGRGINSTTTIAAACLAFGLGIAGCTPVPDAAPLPTLSPVPTVSVPSRSPSAPAAPVAPSPAASSVPAAGIPSVAVPAAPPPSPSAAPAPSPTSPGTAGPLATQPIPVVEPSPEPGTSAAEPTGTAVATTVDADGPAVYYVAIDDGGARGVRFGCNDSLVPVRGVAIPGDPLSVALGRLLEAGIPVDSDAALYDSLAGSSLTFLSGYMNGSTVVVNLSGSLRPSGICDIPRIQAQLIHTVVSATGASRAEIYVNGRTLTEALSVR